MRLHRIFTILLAAVALPALSHAAATEPDIEESSPTDSLLDRARGLYRDIRFLKADMAEYDTIFTTVRETYRAALEVLPRLERRSPDWNSVVNILYDIDPDLENGAYYYTSQNDSARVYDFMTAYLDIQLMDELKGMEFARDPQRFSVITYKAASDSYNARLYDRAIDYFKLYFTTGVLDKREQVYTFLGQACYLTGRYDLAITTMGEGLRQFPSNPYMALIGFQSCIDGQQPEYMHEFLDHALEQNPDDLQLLDALGKLCEDDHDYKRALEVFSRIDELNPKQLAAARHIALCYYNMGVDCFNKAQSEANEKTAVKLRRQAKNYFSAAALKLEEIMVADPMSARYLTMLGRCYLGLEEKEKFDNVNRKLAVLGVNPVTDMFTLPTMSYSDQGLNYPGAVGGARLYDNNEVPPYSEYGARYLYEGLEKWAQRGEFESLEAYETRVNDATAESEINRLSRAAQQSYIDTYSSKLVLSDITLKPYDATNETFLIETSYGPITIHVPNVDNEAVNFKNSWEGVRFVNPRFIIDNDRVQIASVSVAAPNGKSYSYESSRSAAYSQTRVDIDWRSFLAAVEAGNSGGSRKRGESTYTITKRSDVDENIPVTRDRKSNTFALIIANENYQGGTAPVPSALHDGNVFKEYCVKTLGIPEQNITLLEDATFGPFRGAMANLRNTVNSVPNAEVIFYYAGHGMPDERTSDAYLLPVDAIPTQPDTGYALGRLFSDLEEMNASSVLVFMDACFSGASRSGEMMAKARGVEIEANEAEPRGNMYVLTAASGKETALPYAEKNHGLFTYYLLKKLQESKGNVTLKDLADYVITQVKRQSNIVNKKQQTPTVRTSGRMDQLYRSKKMK